MYTKITWSPFATNILDADDYILCTPSGEKAELTRNMSGLFILTVGDRKFETDSNIEMSAYMNTHEIGGVLK